jgi:flagellar hook-associated protein 3 FlgL
MRVSTSHSFNAGIDVLQRRQRELADGQTQLISGKRVQKASDDPTAAARSERALAAITRTEAEARAIEASRNVMTLAEGALGDAGELLQQAREFLVAAGNATYTDHERKGVAQQLRGLRTQLLAIANRSDDAGTYLFAGQGGGVAPFSDEPGGVVYRGVGGDFANAAREPMPLSVDGEAAWLGGDGGGVFATLDRAIRDLDPPPGHTPPPPAQITSEGLTAIDGAMNAMQQLRARIGEVLNRADVAEGRVADERLYHQTERSNAEDLDMVQAVADFQTRQTGYDAALKAYSIVQRMSLFQYLNG